VRREESVASQRARLREREPLARRESKRAKRRANLLFSFSLLGKLVICNYKVLNLKFYHFKLQIRHLPLQICITFKFIITYIFMKTLRYSSLTSAGDCTQTFASVQLLVLCLKNAFVRTMWCHLRWMCLGFIKRILHSCSGNKLSICSS
jgi:hypothetical protein